MIPKERPKLWIIFLVICLISQLMISAAPTVIKSTKEAFADFEQRYEEAQIKKQEERERLEAEREQAKLEAEQNQQEMTGTKEEEQDPKQKLAEEMMSEAFEIISLMSKYVGSLIMIVGVFNFVLGFKEENPEMSARGVSTLVVGCVLIAFSVVGPALLNGESIYSVWNIKGG